MDCAPRPSTTMTPHITWWLYQYADPSLSRRYRRGVLQDQRHFGISGHLLGRSADPQIGAGGTPRRCLLLRAAWRTAIHCLSKAPMQLASACSADCAGIDVGAGRAKDLLPLTAFPAHVLAAAADADLLHAGLPAPLLSWRVPRRCAALPRSCSRCRASLLRSCSARSRPLSAGCHCTGCPTWSGAASSIGDRCGRDPRAAGGGIWLQLHWEAMQMPEFSPGGRCGCIRVGGWLANLMSGIAAVSG